MSPPPPGDEEALGSSPGEGGGRRFEAEETTQMGKELRAPEEPQEGRRGHRMKTSTGIPELSLVISFPDLRRALVLKMTMPSAGMPEGGFLCTMQEDSRTPSKNPKAFCFY